MSLMAQVERARSTLQEANNALSGARGIFPPLRPPQTLVEISPELNSEVVTGMGEALWDMGSDLWDTVTNPIGSVGDALEGVQELIDDPRGTAQEVWEDFTEPYVEDWENGREGEAIGRGLVELGANFIPGYNVLRWLNRFDDANSDDGFEAPEAPPSESGSSGSNELPEGDPPSSDSDGPIDDPPGGDPPAAGSDEPDDDGDSDKDDESGDDNSTNDAGETTTYADKSTARQALEGDQQVAANRFFRDATSKSQDFKTTGIGDGGQRLEFFSPANNPGYGKQYVQEIDASGNVIREYKDTMGPEGLIERKWIHGGP